MKSEVILYSVFLWTVVSLLTGCGLQIPEEIRNNSETIAPEALKSLVDWSFQTPDREERAKRLFFLADKAYGTYQKRQISSPDTDQESQSELSGDQPPEYYLRLAEGALLRVVELGAGPVDLARHNLAVLFREQKENRSQEDQENKPSETSDSGNANKEESPEDQGEKSEGSPEKSEPRDLSALVQDRPEEEVKKEALLAKEQEIRKSREEVTSGTPVPLSEDW